MNRGATWVPFALVLLLAFPVAAGSLRLVELFGGPASLPAKPRISQSPAPAVIHIVSALLFVLLGAFQFSARIRRRHPRWHRRAGRVLLVAGLAAALSAVWMTAFYDKPQDTNDLRLLRLSFGVLMATSLVLAYSAIRRGEIAEHRAWMMRAYAVAAGAATHMFTLGFGHALLGSTEPVTAAMLVAGWTINLMVVEILLWRERMHLPSKVPQLRTSDALH